MIEFTIWGKPVGKDRPVPNPRGGRPFVDKQAAERERHVREEFKSAAGRAWRPIVGPVRVRIIAVFPVPISWPKKLLALAMAGKVWYIGKPDIDNIEKLIYDALNKVAWIDDAQIVYVEKAARYGDPARTEVKIWSMPQPEGAVTPTQLRQEKAIAEGGFAAVLNPQRKHRKSSKAQSS